MRNYFQLPKESIEEYKIIDSNQTVIEQNVIK